MQCSHHLSPEPATLLVIVGDTPRMPLCERHAHVALSANFAGPRHHFQVQRIAATTSPIGDRP